MDANHSEWVELDLNGRVLGCWRPDDFAPDTLVLTSAGRVFLQGGGWRTRSGVSLDRGPKTWLFGAHGASVVFADAVHGPMHLRWCQLS